MVYTSYMMLKTKMYILIPLISFYICLNSVLSACSTPEERGRWEFIRYPSEVYCYEGTLTLGFLDYQEQNIDLIVVRMSDIEYVELYNDTVWIYTNLGETISFLSKRTDRYWVAVHNCFKTTEVPTSGI